MSMTCIFGQAKDNGNIQYDIEIAEIGSQSELVVKVWCYSKKSHIPENLFKECAIKGILFKGVEDSGRKKGREPLVLDGYDNHKDYFDNFFQNNCHNDYVRMAMNGYVDQNGIEKVGKLYRIGKIVVVSYKELRTRLESDGIIKSLNSGF